MRIFVSYGFNERDQWIADLVFPIIEAFGDEVVTGSDMYGGEISQEVQDRIRSSNACIGFLTKRRDGAPGETHRWVVEELALALNSKPRLVEVREIGVNDQPGIMGNRSRITYDETKRDECLVALVKTLGNWHKKADVQLQLLPQDCVEELFPLHRRQGLRCSYRLRVDGEAGPEVPTKIEPIGQGLFVRAKDIPRAALIQVQIEYGERSWTSSFENVDSISIPLKEI